MTSDRPQPPDPHQADDVDPKGPGTKPVGAGGGEVADAEPAMPSADDRDDDADSIDPGSDGTRPIGRDGGEIAS